MRVRPRIPARLALVTALLGTLAAGLIPTSASATTKVGPWWSGHYDCGFHVDFQLHYTNLASNLTRADGFAVHLDDRTSALTGVEIREYSSDGVLRGTYVMIPDFHSDSRTGIGTQFLPWLRPAQRPYVEVRVGFWNNSNPAGEARCPNIPFGQ